jgi:hypothetical protein
MEAARGLPSAVFRCNLATANCYREIDDDKSDQRMYERLRPRQETATRNARRLQSCWNERGKVRAHRENPSTNVHLLVEYLNQLAEVAKSIKPRDRSA